MPRRLIVLAASAAALAPRRAPVKPTQFFRGRFDGKQFRTEPLEAATFDEFSTDEGAAPGAAPQLFTADGAPLMTAPCCIKVVGVGGGGGNAVNRMVETDARELRGFLGDEHGRPSSVAVAGGEHDEHWPGDDARVGCGWDP